MEVANAIDLQARRTTEIIVYLESRAITDAAIARQHNDQLADLQAQVDQIRVAEAKREKKAHWELKKKEDAVRKAMGAVVEDALAVFEKVRGTPGFKTESVQELKNLAESIKVGRSVEEYPLGNPCPRLEHGGENSNSSQLGGDPPNSGDKD